jgi:UDP-N-acetylmuramate dehydrogenase
MLEIQENVDIKDYCTLKVGGQFRYFIEVSEIKYLQEIYDFAKEKNLPIFILGGGSNMVFPDGVLERVVIKINFPGFEIVNDTDDYTDIKIGAGENWDSIVERTVAMNLSGIEAMSAIPGTVGATPVQNVGAYGQEIKDTLIQLEAYDTSTQSMVQITNSECGFSYRDSVFKNESKGRYIITSITLRLSKSTPRIPNYPGVKRYFIENNINNPSLSQIREAIIEIRSDKLPDPKVIPSVGSFFKNTIVPKPVADELKYQYPTMVVFPVNEKETKVPSGFLIEQAGLKGKNFGTISSYSHNAMVLVNNGGATRSDVERVRDEITQIIFDKFGIKLEAEPEFVS